MTNGGKYYFAECKDAMERLKDLLKKDTNKNFFDTSIFIDVIHSMQDEQTKLEMITALLEHGIDVNTKDSLGRTALMAATNRGYLKIVKLLLEWKADVNIKDNEGNIAIEYIPYINYLKIFNILGQKSILKEE